MTTNLIGAIASVISFVLWLPQARTTYLHRHDPSALSGLSRGTFMLVLANALLWGLYAVLTKALWVGAPGLINGPLALWTLWLIHRANRSSRQVDDRECLCGYTGDEPHDFVVTAPPGFGTVHSPCQGATRAGFPTELGKGYEARVVLRPPGPPVQ